MPTFTNPFTANAAPSSPEETAESQFSNPFSSGAAAEGGGKGIIGSIMGIPGAIVGGVGDIVGGVVGLVGAGIHDLGKTVANVLPGEQTIGILNDQDSYRLDNIGMGMVGFGPSGEWDPAKYGITGDLWRRYSPLLPGGTPASETFRMLAEEPVSFALDALTIATAGASAAVTVGSKAVAGTTAATRVAEVTSTLSKAGFGMSAARRAGIRAGLDEIASTRALSASEAFARRMMPEAGLARVGEKFVPTVSAKNPLTRVTAGALVKRVGTEPVSALAARVDDLKAQMDAEVALTGSTTTKTLTKLEADYRLNKQLLDEAQAGGVTRIATDRAASFWARRVARKLGGEMNAQSLFARQQRMKQVEATLKPWIDMDPTIVNRAAGLWQRLDVELVGQEPAHWAGRNLEFEGLGSRQVALEAGASIPLRLQLDPLVRAAADPKLLERTDAVVAALNRTRQRWMENPQLAELGHDIADQVDSIDRLIDHLNDAIDRRVQAQRGIGNADNALLAMDDMRLLNLEQSMKLWEQPGIYGVITPTQMLDRAYLALRAKYGARANYDGVLEGGPDAKALDDALRAHGEAAPVYFPHMDPAELGAWDFFTSKKPVGGARLAADPNLKRNQAKLLERGSYLTDPMEVFSRRAARAVRAEETYRTLMAYGTKLGRPISRLEDLGSNEVLFAPEIMRVGKRTSVRVQDLVDDLTSNGVSPEEAVARAVEDVTKHNIDDISARLASGEETALFAVPRAAADQLNNASKIASTFGPKGGPLAFYDSAMQAWRQLTLFTRPAYVTNQFLGNSAFALLQGSGIIPAIEIMGRRLFAGRLGRSADDAVLANMESLAGFDQLGGSFFGALTQNYTARNAWFGGTRLGRASARVGESTAGRAGKRFMKMERDAAIEIDNAFRASGFVTAAERALGVGVVKRTFRRFRGLQHRIDKVLEGGFSPDNPAVVKQALDEAKMFFGDYASMGPFARHVTRRYLFPWWGFTRHNINLMVRFPIQYPARAEVMLALQRVDEEYKAQYGEIPEWLNGAVPLGPPGSEVNFLSMRGGSPFEGVLQPWTSQLAPLPKMAIERAIGRDLFTGQPFDDPDIITPFGSEQPYRIIRDESGNAVGVEPIEGDVLPGIAEHFLTQFPIYTFAERFASGDASTYDSATLADILQGEGIKYDETGQPLGQEGSGAVLSALLGLPVAEYNLAKFRERIERERQSALTAAQNRTLG